MGLSTKKIAEIRITTSPRNEILEEIRKYIKKGKSQKTKVKSEEIKPLVIFTPNPEIIVYAQRDKDFVQIVNSAQINLPDGGGMVWALRKLNGISVERISGVDFMLDLCNLANSQSLTVGLIGGREGVALETKECLLKKYPGLKMEVFEAPEIEKSKIKNQKSGPKAHQPLAEKIHIKNKKDKDTSDGGRLSLRSRDSSEVEELEEGYFKWLAYEIVKRKIDILFVALGFPKQEYFIADLRRSLDLLKLDGRINLVGRPIILMAVGGSFDYISGRVPRAPKFMREAGFEWLYRLIREPWRLPRQLKGTEFFWRIFNS